MPAGNYGHSIDLGKELEEEAMQEDASQGPPEEQPPEQNLPSKPQTTEQPAPDEPHEQPASLPQTEHAETPTEPSSEQSQQVTAIPEEEQEDEPPEEPPRPPDPGEEDIIEIISKDTPTLARQKTLADSIVAARMPILLVFVLLAGIVAWSVFRAPPETLAQLPAEGKALPTGEAFFDDSELFPLFELDEPVLLEVNDSLLEQMPQVSAPAPQNKSIELASILAEGLRD
jgi:hypothetical protein